MISNFGFERFTNREQSWLLFNERVLLEAENPRTPLLEKIKFLAIFESNLDEFYMVRVSGLIEQAASGYKALTPDGMTPESQLKLIAQMVRPMRAKAAKIWKDKLLPELESEGIRILAFDEIQGEAKDSLREFFENEVFPLCTPLMISPAITFPFISNRSLNLAVELKDGDEEKLARVKIPNGISRLIAVPGRDAEFILLEDLIVAHLHLLFSGVELGESFLFRVVRDADIEIRELEAADLISAIEQTLRLRRYGDPVFLEVEKGMPSRWRQLLEKGLELEDDDVFEVDYQLGMEFLWELASVNRPELKFEKHVPMVSRNEIHGGELFKRLKEGDVLVHLPYESFEPIEEFVRSAAEDPQVIGIKQTLYRVGSESPIVENLLAAAEAGKQVAVMVELKARFDESNNLIWARALERAGVHVSYGMLEMKVHCKLCLIVRKEADQIRSYVHIGTGNYNPQTAKLYTDLGLFTCDEEIVQDVTELFNYLTGYSRQVSYRKLLVAPHSLREQILDQIDHVIESHQVHGNGRIAFKVNSLVDPEVIDALYEASRAGVKVDLVVRGICCLRPGVEGLSENIRVVSIIGRFLEHSRIYLFENGDGSTKAYIGSADIMRRNLDRRIEVLVPVEDDSQIQFLRDVVIEFALRDNVQSWEGLADGGYQKRASDGTEFCSQIELMSRTAFELG